MSTKFFNNSEHNTLFDKLKGIAEGMPTLHSFLAVAGYFRSSGYFKLRREFSRLQEIKILVGIDLDDIFRKHHTALFQMGDEEEAMKLYTQDFLRDIKEAKYSAEVEEGMLQFCEDIISGKLEIRIHQSKNLHAKFYLCLPKDFSPNTDGWVIMGSSNISDSGLGVTRPARYELNVAMKDYDDVSYCKKEFDTLWQESIPITADDMKQMRRQTHLLAEPTPYEIYMKVLIDAFGEQVEDDFTLQLPDGYMNLKYQNDAVIQGFQMLKEYDGFFLADVVGTGKTVIAAMIAKRFIEENGRNTKVLVIYPPAVRDNWHDTFQDFKITSHTRFISNGSLDKIFERESNDEDAGEYDLVIVDEAHGFRSDATKRYDALQRICKAGRANKGFIKGDKKKVMLLSATPLNNTPEDFRNLILLFQDAGRPTIDGITNITTLFQPWIQQYKILMRDRGEKDLAYLTKETDKIYEEMRTTILDKILVRRTRKNLWSNPTYRADLEAQGVSFPQVEAPVELRYQLNDKLADLFSRTIQMLTNIPSAVPVESGMGGYPTEDGLYYARYRAIEYVIGEKAEKYRNAPQASTAFSGIFRTHMVKRLESSFHAFKKSLHTFLRITEDLIQMWNKDYILIVPKMDIQGMLERGEELEDLFEKALQKGLSEEEILFRQQDFKPEYIHMLKADAEKLQRLIKEWDQVLADPKYEVFRHHIEQMLLQESVKGTDGVEQAFNPSGKLVIFSESQDTITYLGRRLREDLGRKDILVVSAHNNSTQMLKEVQANFDANYKGEWQDKYNIIICTDVLAEGVNLHRTNVIVNYDSPWNATRLMQRIGRVNRIGSKAEYIHSYMFYPSDAGDHEIKLYANALMKLQGFHSALGEDAQVFSREEILREFQLFDDQVRDHVDRQLELLREVRELHTHNEALYKKIKKIPPKSRVTRQAKYRPSGMKPNTTIVHIVSGRRSQFYQIAGAEGKLTPIDFIDAAEAIQAQPQEEQGDFQAIKELHYDHVQSARDTYEKEIKEAETPEVSMVTKQKDKNTTQALAFLRALKREVLSDEAKVEIKTLVKYVSEGRYAQLTLTLTRSARRNTRLRNQGISVTAEEHETEIHTLYDTYCTKGAKSEETPSHSDIEIITSITFQ